jgi:uroporphyrinogen decarboxylase
LELINDSTIRDEITQLADFDPYLSGLFRTDVGAVFPDRPDCTVGEEPPAGRIEYYRLTDEFGIGWQMPVNNGLYYDQYYHPLAFAETVKDIENYPWPDPLDPARFEGMERSGGQGYRPGTEGLFPGKDEFRHVGACHVDDRL